MAERRERFVTSSGIELPNDFNPENTTPVDYGTDLGEPGQFPYTRGVRKNLYRGRFWTMRQYAGFATAEESNARYKYLLSQGTTGLSVAFDLPTQIGLDSDDPLAAGEVGKVGVAIDSLDDMLTLFNGIPLDQVSTSMTINATASTLLCLYLAVARKQNVSFDKVSGTIQNDILKEYIARGTYIYPPKPSLRLITDTFAYCAAEVPNWNTISISGYHIREAGSTAAQEIAFTLADGIAYVQAAIDVGLGVDDFGPRLSFFFNAHNNLLEEVAKYRAARRLCAAQPGHVGLLAEGQLDHRRAEGEIAGHAEIGLGGLLLVEALLGLAHRAHDGRAPLRVFVYADAKVDLVRPWVVLEHADQGNDLVGRGGLQVFEHRSNPEKEAAAS